MNDEEQDQRRPTEEHPPDLYEWWRHRKTQSYLGIIGLIGISAAAIYFNVDVAAASLLKWAGIGCVFLIIQYGPLSSCVDIVRAWKGN